MSRTKLKTLMMLLMIILIGGCATMGDVAVSKDSGTSAVYPVTADQAWDISKTVFAGRVLMWQGIRVRSTPLTIKPVLTYFFIEMAMPASASKSGQA